MREIQYKNAFKIKGAMIALHLKKDKEINLSVVIELLKGFHNHSETYAPTNPSEQEMLNLIHWQIYFDANQKTH